MNPAAEKKLLDSLINKDYPLFKKAITEALLCTKERMIVESVLGKGKLPL